MFGPECSTEANWIFNSSPGLYSASAVMIHHDSSAAADMATERPCNGARVSPKQRQRVKIAGSSNGSMNGPLYMQTPKTVLIRRLKRKDDGPWKQMSRWFVENQVGVFFLSLNVVPEQLLTCSLPLFTGFSLNLISLLFLAHVSIPKARGHTIKFFTLSYFNPKSGNYANGYDDAYLICFCVMVLTGLRAACMEYMLAPFAKWRGLTKRKEVTRFSEQAWMVLYYVIFWAFGMVRTRSLSCHLVVARARYQTNVFTAFHQYIYAHSAYWMNLTELWANWPIRELSGITKTYMLLQWSFWLQQVIVINIEDRRKDHWQMLTHHVITIGLIQSSYCYHFTRIGNLILVIMDPVDILLPVSSFPFHTSAYIHLGSVKHLIKSLSSKNSLPSASSILGTRSFVTMCSELS